MKNFITSSFDGSFYLLKADITEVMENAVSGKYINVNYITENFVSMFRFNEWTSESRR